MQNYSFILERLMAQDGNDTMITYTGDGSVNILYHSFDHGFGFSITDSVIDERNISRNYFEAINVLKAMAISFEPPDLRLLGNIENIAIQVHRPDREDGTAYMVMADFKPHSRREITAAFGKATETADRIARLEIANVQKYMQEYGEKLEGMEHISTALAIEVMGGFAKNGHRAADNNTRLAKQVAEVLEAKYASEEQGYNPHPDMPYKDDGEYDFSSTTPYDIKPEPVVKQPVLAYPGREKALRKKLEKFPSEQVKAVLNALRTVDSDPLRNVSVDARGTKGDLLYNPIETALKEVITDDGTRELTVGAFCTSIHREIAAPSREYGA